MRNNEHTRALLPCRGWSAQARMATQELPSLALPCLALPCLALLCLALPCFALLCFALLCAAAALCLLCALPCLALLTLFRGPIPQRQGRQIQPAGRRAWMRDVFVRDMDVPYKNFCRTCAPVARSASGARTGCAFFWLLFFAQAKKSDSRPKGVKALLLASQEPPSRTLRKAQTSTEPATRKRRTIALNSPNRATINLTHSTTRTPAPTN